MFFLIVVIFYDGYIVVMDNWLMIFFIFVENWFVGGKMGFDGFSLVFICFLGWYLFRLFFLIYM